MLPCWKPPSSTDHSFVSATSQGYSADNTPTSSALISPRINITHEFTRTLNSNSFVEVQRAFTENFSFDHALESVQLDLFDESQLLKPSRESVQKALFLIKLQPLAHLVGEFFDESEKVLRLCVVVYERVQHARRIYQPICDALHDIPLEFEWDSCYLASPKCKFAFDSILLWDKLANPFFSLDSSKFECICGNLARLRQGLIHVKRSKSKLLFNGCSYWGSCVSCSVNCMDPSRLRCGRSLDRGQNDPSCSQLEAAGRSAFFAQNHLSTIHPLVSRLHSTFESDKDLIRHLQLGLGDDMDRYSIQEALKHLQINWPSFDKQLVDLENHLMLCCSEVNKARIRLFQEIHQHSDSDSL